MNMRHSPLRGSSPKPLARQPLTKDEYKEALAKGEKALSGYYDEYYKSWSHKTLSEFDISGVELPTKAIDDIRSIRLTGKIDRMDLLKADSYKLKAHLMP